MIFYFSGTGNSKWVAKEIATKTEDIATDILSLKELPNLENQKQIGLVFPIYAWGVAEPMLEFATMLPKTTAFTFGICTCGADAGLAMKKLSRIFKMQSCYSIILPSTYIVGADIENDEIIKDKFAKAKEEITAIVSEISDKKTVYRVNEGSLASLKSNFATKGFNKFGRNTKPFYADEKCIACGLCEKQCSSKTIKILDSKPMWGKKCYQCLKCINCCPKQAIQYSEKTAQRSRYSIDNWIDKI